MARQRTFQTVPPPPETVSYLLEYSVLKTLAQRVGVEHIDRRQGRPVHAGRELLGPLKERRGDMRAAR